MILASWSLYAREPMCRTCKLQRKAPARICTRNLPAVTHSYNVKDIIISEHRSLNWIKYTINRSMSWILCLKFDWLKLWTWFSDLFALGLFIEGTSSCYCNLLPQQISLRNVWNNLTCSLVCVADIVGPLALDCFEKDRSQSGQRSAW